MGLDMYLNRMPRYGNTTPDKISALENYLDWKEKCQRFGSRAKKCSFKEWTGINYNDVPRGDVRKFYQQHYAVKYYAWDTEKHFPHGSIIEQVGYWRKANHIHNWFVENVQDGQDDCEYHQEVTKEILEELLYVCKMVLASCEMVDGTINNGIEFNNGVATPITANGKYVKDASVAQRMLPTSPGFFFGSYDYDEYYVADVEETIAIIEKVLATTDFETQMIYYVSSW